MEPGQQSWTTETLHQHIRVIIDERDRRYEALAIAQKEAVEAALKSAQLAVDKAETINIAWRANANEWRMAMSDKDKNFVTKDDMRNNLRTVLIAIPVVTGLFQFLVWVLTRHGS